MSGLTAREIAVTCMSLRWHMRVVPHLSIELHVLHPVTNDLIDGCYMLESINMIHVYWLLMVPVVN